MKTIHATLLLLTVLAAVEAPLSAQPAGGGALTSVSQVRKLPAAEAEKKVPVTLRGVVTFADNRLFSRFLQDGTAGIYLLESEATNLVAGMEVELEGTTSPGEFAPVIQPKSVKVLGAGKLPAAKPVDWDELVSGKHDSQWVEFAGQVRAVRFEKNTGYHIVDFVRGSERISAYVPQLPVADGQSLVEARVRVRGVCATLFNHQRQLFGVRLLAPAAEPLVVEQPAPGNPFDESPQPITALLRFAPEGTTTGRVKAIGTVTYAEPGRAVFIQDEAGGVHCQTASRDLPAPGAKVEVVGFPARGEYTPVLDDALVKKVGEGGEPVAAAVDVNELLTGKHDCRLVQLSARVLANVQRGLNRFLLLESGGLTFQAHIPQGFALDSLESLQEGAIINARGVCVIERGSEWQAGDNWRASSFRLLLRSAKDVSVLQAPVKDLSDQGSLVVVLLIIVAGLLVWVAALRLKMRGAAGHR